MDHSVHNKLVSFIWSIADDCLRDVYVRGKYRDVILPMVVLRRLDTLLEPTKQQVLDEVREQKEEQDFIELDALSLQHVSGYVFYNTSKWTLKSLFDTATNNQQILLANFEDYLRGFSDNVKEIVSRFNLQNQIRHMANKDVLLDVLEKFVSPKINLSPFDMTDPDGYKLAGLSNLGMGYVFEELIRKFNEENNEEAGEHFTPREVIELMTHLVFDPIKDQIPYALSVYDPACGSGGMLTESQNFIDARYGENIDRDIFLYGKEINDETYAICKSDMMIKGNNPENIRVGSTLSTDEFASTRFDFMLSNPPYGKSWASEQKYIKSGNDVIDPRFKVLLKDYWGNEAELDATPRSSDGQLLFLMEMVSKIKPTTVSPIGSRIASVHNGSSLFTGDAGGGESNIRRYIIENDLLNAIVQLPNNLFYNTGITTYIWLLSNHKPEHRKGKVQLIDASLLYRKLRKNLGNKNCEFAPEHIAEIVQCYLDGNEVNRQIDSHHDPIGLAAKVFDNQDFGYYKVNIERPDRRKAQFSLDKLEVLKFDKALLEPMQYMLEQYGDDIYTVEFLKKIEKDVVAWCDDQEMSLNTKAKTKLFDIKHWLSLNALFESAKALMQHIGHVEYNDYNVFKKDVDEAIHDLGLSLSAPEKNSILNAVSWYDESAEKVIKKVIKLNAEKLDDLLNYLGCQEKDLADFGYYATSKSGEYVTYESNADIRDSESIPLKQHIHTYFINEVKPHVDEAWINLDSVKIGYEISFNKYFYQHKPLRSLDEVAKDILALEQQADGLIAQILGI
ncbi:type I restriction-modification system subunit M [Acinetobacter modestus]|uniref:type I restriction-modification system subunit M n=1 Tax=Acinetobacter modestus TaxID=1776740 RepID=UPI001F4ADE0C|nr:class I SAM-dependent DNA methyltransferase [Acinetobacter modestus]MCH7334666.1 type I restriction-modification system subunit M [Acinetobacter modestus]